jgi:isoleucyl-tRNA synthetase
MLASGSPWLPRRVGHATIQEGVRKVLLTYWNTAAFLSLYGRTAVWTPAHGAPPVPDRPVLDRWVLSELNRLVRDVDAAMDGFDTQRAGARLTALVDDLSNWYVRRSRRRFWDGDPAALATLHECVEVLTRLLAPMVPFATERIWQDVVRAVTPDAPESVHMASWPSADESAIDDELAAHVSLTRRLVELGRAARAESKVRTRQPLARALVGARGWDDLPPELRAEVADELNVAEVASLGATGGELIDVGVKANFRSLGRRFAKDTPRVAAAVAAADATALAADLRAGGTATVQVEGLGEVALDDEDVVLTESPREGWAVAREGETVALDLHLTPALVRAGLAREVIRLVQEARKSAGYDVSDRIELAWVADGELGAALREHAAAVADDVLAVRVHDDLDALKGQPDHGDTDLGLTFRLRRVQPADGGWGSR